MLPALAVKHGKHSSQHSACFMHSILQAPPHQAPHVIHTQLHRRKPSQQSPHRHRRYNHFISLTAHHHFTHESGTPFRACSTHLHIASTQSLSLCNEKHITTHELPSSHTHYSAPSCLAHSAFCNELPSSHTHYSAPSCLALTHTTLQRAV